jgi:hypothetical protein
LATTEDLGKYCSLPKLEFLVLSFLMSSCSCKSLISYVQSLFWHEVIEVIEMIFEENWYLF